MPDGGHELAPATVAHLVKAPLWRLRCIASSKAGGLRADEAVLSHLVALLDSKGANLNTVMKAFGFLLFIIF